MNAAPQQKNFLTPGEVEFFGRLQKKRGPGARTRMVLVPRAMASERELDWHDRRIDNRTPILVRLRRQGVPWHLANEAAAYHARLFEMAYPKAHAGRPVQVNTAEQTHMVAARNLGTWRSAARRRKRGESEARDKHRERLNRLLLGIGMLRAGWGWVQPVDRSEAEATGFAPNTRDRMSRVIPCPAIEIHHTIAPQMHSSHDGGAHFPLDLSNSHKSPKSHRAPGQRVRVRGADGKFEKKPALQPPPPQVVEAQRPDPPAVSEVAGVVLTFSAGTPDADRIAAYGRLHEQQGEFSPVQEADFRQICERDTAHWAAVLQAEEARPPPTPAPAPVSPPPRAARTAAGVQVPAGATRAHERVVDALAEKLGVPLGEADEAALCLAPATREQLAAAVPGLTATWGLADKLSARGFSVAAVHHAWRHTFRGRGDPPPGYNYTGRLVNAAKRTQMFFVGKAGGWDPYRALGQSRSAQGAGRPRRGGW